MTESEINKLYFKEYRLKNKDKIKKAQNKYYLKPDNKLKKKQQAQKRSNELSDIYIKTCIKQYYSYKNIKISFKDITKDMITNKRNKIIKLRNEKISNIKICKCGNSYTRITNKKVNNMCTICNTNKLKKYNIINREHFLSLGRKNSKKYKENLSNTYIKTIIIAPLRKIGLNISFKDIPQELIELKRKELQTKRLLKNKQNGKN